MSAEMYLVNQQKHRPALHDDVLCSHGPDLKREANATRDGEKEDGLPVLGLFVIRPETVRLRPDQEGLVFDGCLGHKAPVHCRCVGLKASAYQHALSDLGNVTRDFMWRTPATWG